MRPKLIKISLIIVAILVAGVLYWYFNCQLPKTTPAQTQNMEETKRIEEKGTRSIQLEKPPFIKD
ncbi:hypothetical protein J7J95_03070 [bacterium]|nr:hypothetical protein [bacterium]